MIISDFVDFNDGLRCCGGVCYGGKMCCCTTSTNANEHRAVRKLCDNRCAIEDGFFIFI